MFCVHYYYYIIRFRRKNMNVNSQFKPFFFITFIIIKPLIGDMQPGGAGLPCDYVSVPFFFFFPRNPTAYDPSASASRTGIMVKVHRKPRDVITSRLSQSTHVLCYGSWPRSSPDMMSFLMFQRIWIFRKGNFAFILFGALLDFWHWVHLSTFDLPEMDRKKSTVYKAAEVTWRWK